MKFKNKILVLIVLIIFSVTGSASAATLEEVSNELVCQCGCTLILTNCNHSGCGVAVPMRKIISEKLSNGETKKQIIAYFVSQYGEAVLASPAKKGFNLTVWILPFLGIIVGGGIITLIILVWVKRRRQTLAYEGADEIQTEIDDKYEKIFDREFKDFE
ncbi:MAG: hypothetical protein GXP33_02485 [Spirochaetes bacterium]|nr:hypothetical protein [Spirochaetota bacterium]